MVPWPAAFSRFSLRAVVFALITIPLVSLAGKVQAEMPRLSPAAALFLVAGFCYLEAIVIVLIKRMFRAVP